MLRIGSHLRRKWLRRPRKAEKLKAEKPKSLDAFAEKAMASEEGLGG